MRGFHYPPGNPDSLSGAVRGLGRLHGDLTGCAGSISRAFDAALSTWVATRADDFRQAGEGIGMAVRGSSSLVEGTGHVLQEYAQRLRDGQDEIDQLHRQARSRMTAVEDLDPEDADENSRIETAHSRVADLRALAAEVRDEVARAARSAAEHLNAGTDILVPDGSTLSADQLARRVHGRTDVSGVRSALGADGLTYSDAWAALAAPGGALGPIVMDRSGAPRDGGRSSLLTELQTSHDAWLRLVDQETIHRDATNVRYFNITPSPGGGVVVVDWWIPDDSSGVLLNGDGRGDDYVDPLDGMVEYERSDGEMQERPLELTDSRILVTMDLEAGRASITQSETCTISALGRRFCNEPREISFDDQWVNDSEHDATGEGINLDQANQFDISSTDSGYRIEYDALNSITPSGSVDGGIELRRGADGSFESERFGDGYPAIATTNYHDGDRHQTVHPNEGLPSAIPIVSDFLDLFSSDEGIPMAPGPIGEPYDPPGEPL